ncbi:WhiB family transcriptional regulator [Mycobacteroides sp. PCS013]|uniref:WhiB family transcriptional regulator n=1 Tax=Mycobacteroides sp. PCS013 TaxID=3074106 RepID=UPI003C2BD9AA
MSIQALGSPPKWAVNAVCAESTSEFFYPDEQDYITASAAKWACRRCPVRDECLQWALENDEQFGVWGATTPKERRRIKRTAGER